MVVWSVHPSYWETICILSSYLRIIGVLPPSPVHLSRVGQRRLSQPSPGDGFHLQFLDSHNQQELVSAAAAIQDDLL